MKHEAIPVLAQLRHALSSDLSRDAKDLAQRLHDRLIRPVRLIVVGHAKSGKTTLCDLLNSGPTTAGLSLVEELIEGDPTKLRRQLDGWTTRADIILWCGQDFDARDQAIWDRVPDRIKDHSFLVVTKADVLAARGRLQSCLAGLQTMTDAFHNVLPLATLQALAARPLSGVVNMAAFRASGGAALETALLRDVQTGLAAVKDSATLFLQRHGIATLQAHIAAAQPTTQAESWAATHLFLESTTGALVPVVTLPPANQVTAVLEYCLSTSQALADRLSPGQRSTQPSLCEDIMTLADTVQLICVEGSPSAARDALGMIWQIRNEIAECAAY